MNHRGGAEFFVTPPPKQPKIYHITHVANLAGIALDGVLSDREMIRRGGPAHAIGMSEIKRRRLEEIAVDRHPGTTVGEYVPFYFCPRSVMLYVIHCANNPELGYRGGQDPIVHLEADLHQVVQWAEASGRRWAFSLSNAGSYYVQFRSQIAELDQLDWPAIAKTDFRSPNVKEKKQAEFLVYEQFPFELVNRIGVRSGVIQAQATAAINGATHQPPVQVCPQWYY